MERGRGDGKEGERTRNDNITICLRGAGERGGGGREEGERKGGREGGKRGRG